MSEETRQERPLGIPEILEKIRSKLPRLHGEEKLLGEYILLNYGTVPKLSLVQLAEEADVHPSAVVRFCDDVGCEGFHALHTALAEIDSVAASVFFEQVDGFDLEHITRSVLTTSKRCWTRP